MKSCFVYFKDYIKIKENARKTWQFPSGAGKLLQVTSELFLNSQK